MYIFGLKIFPSLNQVLEYEGCFFNSVERMSVWHLQHGLDHDSDPIKTVRIQQYWSYTA